MTTTEYLQREIRRAELSIRRAERKPHTPPEELRGLREKLEHLKEAMNAVDKVPPADVRQVVRGRWLHETEIDGHACGEGGCRK